MMDAMAEVTPHEIEAKFLVKDAAAFAQWETAGEFASGYDLGAATEVTVVDTYVDTPDFRLLRKGFGLRMRQQNGLRLATLKATRMADAASIFRRIEIEEPLADEAQIDDLSGWPEAIRNALEDVATESARLQPLCTLRQQRIKRPLCALRRLTPHQRKHRSVQVAELSLDTIQVCAGADGPAVAHYHELEIELAPGLDEQELHALVAAMPAQSALAPSARSKLEHALALLGNHAAGAPENSLGLVPAMHMAEACRLIWRKQLTAMLLNEAGVRFSENPEYIHDMRVATRRARAAAKLYGGYFRPKAIRSALKALRRTARLLGAVRDLDVAMSGLEQFDAKHNGKTSAFAGTLAGCQVRRDAAHDELIAWLDSEAYYRFVTRFAAFCQSPGKGVLTREVRPGKPPEPCQVRHVTPSLIMNCFERVRTFETLFEGENAVPVETLYLLQIECKYLRYNLEFVDELLGQEARQVIGALRTLQDRLDNMNDAAVGAQMVVAGPEGQSEAAGRYLAAQDKIVQRLRRRVAEDLRHFVAPANRRRLAIAIAGI
jgi:triphosphatase